MNDQNQTTNAPAFNVTRAENPDQLKAIRLREDVCDDKDLTPNARLMFVRLLDIALNSTLYNGVKGGVKGRALISQMRIAEMLGCDERSVRRNTAELVAKNYLWTKLTGMSNTKPMYAYNVTAFNPKPRLAEDVPGEGLKGDGKSRRWDHGFRSKQGENLATGKSATGHQRRGELGLLDPRGRPISLNLFEFAAKNGQSAPPTADNIDRSERTQMHPASGQNCPLIPDNGVRSQRPELSADSGQKSPLPPVANVRSIESQYEQESTEIREGKGIPPDLAAFRESLKGQYPSRLEKMRKELDEKARKANSPKARKEWQQRRQIVEDVMFGGPVQDEPHKPQPVRKAPAPEREQTREELLEGARYLVNIERPHLLTAAQRNVLVEAGEL